MPSRHVSRRGTSHVERHASLSGAFELQHVDTDQSWSPSTTSTAQSGSAKKTGSAKQQSDTENNENPGDDVGHHQPPAPTTPGGSGVLSILVIVSLQIARS